jgi:hypothetical protein
MAGFLLLMALGGALAGLCATWVFVSLVGIIIVPAAVVAMLWSGASFAAALATALAGYVVLQVAYVATGWASGWRGAAAWRAWRGGTPQEHSAGPSPFADARADIPFAPQWEDQSRTRSVDASAMTASTPLAPGVAGRPQASPFAPRRGGDRWPVFGGWLPLLAFYEPPCERDGGLWDGVQDPGYRVTIFVMGWLNRAVSISIGGPRPIAKARHAPVPDAGEPPRSRQTDTAQSEKPHGGTL